ncbi:MAG: response regulator transcription factor, partial [Caldilineaceae bacterium]
MNVMLVDDHPLFMEGLHNLLAARGINVVGTAHNGREAVQQALRLRPDVVLMDIQMPECDGLHALHRIKEEAPAINVIMLTMSTDDDHLFEAIKGGAAGYLLKDLNADTFFELLTNVANGGAALTPAIAARVMAEFANPRHHTPPVKTTEPDGLTERQIEVLQLMARGCTNKEIADELFIAERTVKYHTREILQKLHLRNRAQAVAYA